MPRYVAFLRGVSPMNAKMPELKRCFEAAGFSQVKTVLSSGNLIFDSTRKSETAIEKAAEAAMQQGLGRSFRCTVRPVSRLETLLAQDPYAAHGVPTDAKRVVSFLREPLQPRLPLPLAADDAAVLCQDGREIYTAYLPHPKGPVFMTLIERAFGSDVTTRTWATVKRCAAA